MHRWAGRILKRFSNQPATLRNLLSILAACAIWSFFFWRALHTFGPDRGGIKVDFSSDSAIPVLMSNDDGRITIFNRYYYGADRWGAWAFVVTQRIRRTIGYRWTPESVFTVQALWVFIGVWIFSALTPRDRVPVLVLCLIALCLHREARYLMFELSQIYGWQGPAVLLSWYGMRRLFEGFIGPSTRLGTAPSATLGTDFSRRYATLARVGWTLFVLGASFLAIWSSVASTVFCFFLVGVETLRAWLIASAKAVSRYLVFTPAVVGVAAVAAAAMMERRQKWEYNRYSAEHFYNSFTTDFRIDSPHLAQNFGKQLNNLVQLSWWPLYLLPMVLLLALTVGFVYLAFRRDDHRLKRLRDVLAEDTTFLAIGALGIAAINFSLTVSVSHVRINGWDSRYLTLTNLFGPVSGLLTVYLLIELAVRQAHVRTWIQLTYAAAALGVLTLRFPMPSYSLEYRRLTETANELARKAPGSVLLGSYWDTYVFAALQPSGAMTPVVFQGEVQRTPWTVATLRRARHIIVVFRRTPKRAIPPPPTLLQYDTTLTLIDPKWYETEFYAFALYANTT